MGRLLNRRRVLSGLAAASTVAVVAPERTASSELPSSAEGFLSEEAQMNIINQQFASPSLLALIDAHKAAHGAFLAALDREQEMEKAYFAAHPVKEIVVPLSLGGGQSLYVRYDLDEAFEDCRAQIASRYDDERKRLSGIERLAPDIAAQADAILRAKEAADNRNLRRIVKEEKKRREAFGYAQALRDRDEGSDRETEAALALLSYPCRTVADGRTRADYIMAGGRKSLGRIIYDSLTCGDECFVDALLLSAAEPAGQQQLIAAE